MSQSKGGLAGGDHPVRADLKAGEFVLSRDALARLIDERIADVFGQIVDRGNYEGQVSE